MKRGGGEGMGTGCIQKIKANWLPLEDWQCNLGLVGYFGSLTKYHLHVSDEAFGWPLGAELHEIILILLEELLQIFLLVLTLIVLNV